MKSKVENDVFESRAEADRSPPTPSAVLTLNTNKKAKMMLFPVETDLAQKDIRYSAGVVFQFGSK